MKVIFHLSHMSVVSWLQVDLVVFTPGLMEGNWDSIWDTDGFIAEGKETDVMNYSLTLTTCVWEFPLWLNGNEPD